MKVFFKLLRLSAIPVLMLAAVLLFSTALSEMNADKASHDLEKLEETLTRAAVSCYAVEGAYPPNVDYLAENYSVQIDTDRYTVKYELYASNLMPSITVLENPEK